MLLEIVQTVNSYLSDYILVFLLIAVGLLYSIKTRFVQIRYFGQGMRQVFGTLSLNGQKHKTGMSSFQALATALASTIGTGSIAGVATAIWFGGPGAVFWMWVSALLGMMTGCAEKLLSVRYRRAGPAGWLGGPCTTSWTA